MSVDDSPLAYPKTDKIPVPAYENPAEYVRATDWNTLCTVVDSLRDNIPLALVLDKSEVEIAAGGATVTLDNGDYTGGTIFVPTRAGMTCTGLHFYWPGGASKTVKCSLWNTAGTRLQTVNVAASTAGIYTATWTSTETLTAGKHYRVSIWVNDSTKYVYLTSGNLSTYTASTFVIGDLNGKTIGPGVFRYQGGYAAGDAFPSTADATNLYLVEPTFEAL